MSTNQQDYASSGHLDLYAEKEGERHIDKILSAVKSEPLAITLLQLAWTAGPLTYIALQGGYLLGYGKTAPFAVFTYFAGYTLITGLIGIILRISYKAYQNSYSDKQKNNYLSTIDNLFRLTQQLADFRLSQLTPHERKVESSIFLLRNTEAFPAAIALGVEELTESKSLAELIKQVDLLRRAGLDSRAKEVTASHAELDNEKLQSLLNTPSEAAYFLKMRLEGHAPTLSEGVKRTDGFLQRIAIAREYQDPSIMHLKDPEEFLTLLYELLNGRKIEFLTFSYLGKKKLRQSAKALEKTRANFSAARAALYYDIDALYTKMVNFELIDDVKNFDFRIKSEQIFSALSHLAATIVGFDKFISQNELKIIHLFASLAKTYTRLYQQYRVLVALDIQRQSAVSQWKAAAERYSDRATRFRYGWGKRGLRITKKTISLNDEAKRLCCNAIVEMVADFIHENNHNQQLSPLTVKQFILRLTDKTNIFFDITNPIIHYGIESSKATNFGALAADFSVESRALWTAAMVKETASHLDHAAEQLVKFLLYEYDEVIDEKAIDFLVTTFGANKNNLINLVKEHSLSESRPFLGVQVEIPKKPLKWDVIIKNAKKKKVV